jgi:hypothetical protein
MPTPTPLHLLFAAGLAIGCWRAYRLLITNRRSIATTDTLHQWWGARLSAWKVEPQVTVAVMVHTGAVVLLGVVALAAALKPATFNRPPFTEDATMVGLAWLIEGGSMLLGGYLLGALLAFPLASLERKPVAYAISANGMVYGRTLMPWHWFSHFSLERSTRLLRLYSSFAPDLPSFTLELPEPVEELEQALAQHLPPGETAATRAWYRTRRMLVPEMVLLCLLFLSLGCLAARMPRELALFTIVLFTALLAALGGKLITLFGFGTLNLDESNPQPAEKKHER